ncbi:AaceriAER267Wp [[Ashbya] aceris (nom. inval.)]|nr:AaceriAER267Wp [[Ashbya] aceris (nom. inval.)]
MVVHVLFIDSYDSFTYNVVQLIKDQDGVAVTTIHNDSFADFSQLEGYLSAFDAIVVGPGPGNPANGSADIGIIESLFKLEVAVPVLGICLGMQAMCYARGCKIEQLQTIKHGQIYRMDVADRTNELFSAFPESFSSVRYHSLHVADLVEDILPLAYTKDENGDVLMAAQIRGLPWYGVQYHPESCCSELGPQLISNFLRIAARYNESSGRMAKEIRPLREDMDRLNRILLELDQCIDKKPTCEKAASCEKAIQLETYDVPKDPSLVLNVCDNLTDPFFLMASSSLKPKCGSVSIIALPDENSTVFTHYVQLNKTTIHRWRESSLTPESYSAAVHGTTSSPYVQVLSEDKQRFWATLGEFMNSKSISNYPELPFIGGLVGILGYELGQFLDHYYEKALQPDAKLVYIENSILIDHATGKLHLISLKNDFPQSVREAVTAAVNKGSEAPNWPVRLPEDVSFDINFPSKDAYATAFEKTQKYLHEGTSYEICITTQTEITPSRRVTPWRLFQTLVRRNPSPFSSFFEFSDITADYSDICLISTSPERYIKWTPDACELRPIKGTVKKVPGLTQDDARAILTTPKEFGENLMILDLIRNDLFELFPHVTAEDIMLVEEYETVFQLVSVVEAHGIRASPYGGLDILKHTLPPGSMTGAPKKITVELLQRDIEDTLNEHLPSVRGTRGVYSGITGYLSVNGNADWSVNIRCMYSYDNASTWRIGAGGAVTVLSTLDGEWEEMHTKLESALQIFQ